MSEGLTNVDPRQSVERPWTGDAYQDLPRRRLDVPGSLLQPAEIEEQTLVQRIRNLEARAEEQGDATHSLITELHRDIQRIDKALADLAARIG